MFFERPRHRVVFAVGFQRAGAHPVERLMGLVESANIHRPQIHRRFAGGDPFRQRAAGAAGRGNAKGVEARADVKIFQLRRFAENEITIGRERFRPV